ncbi:MAG: WG repeat-containing protein [Bacteroidia bacterium]
MTSSRTNFHNYSSANRGRKLRTFDVMISLIKYRSFLLFFFILISKSAFSQAVNLTKFRVDRIGVDGMIYVFEGMKDGQGKEVIPANYDYIWDFEDTLTLARKRVDIGTSDDEGAFTYQIISNTGFLYYEFPDYLFPENLSNKRILTWNSRNGSYGYLDPFGKEVVKFQFNNAKDFSENLAAVKKSMRSQWDFIDIDGKYKTSYSFDDAFSFSEGFAVVKKGNKHSFLNKLGALVLIEKEYQQVFDVREGKSIVTHVKGDTILYGIIGSDGKEILKPQFEFIDNFEGETAVFVNKGEAGMLDAKGNILIRAAYDELYRFDQSHYLFQQNGLQGLIRIDGTPVLSADYSAIGLFHEGLCAVRKGNLWGFANTDGEVVIPFLYSEIGSTFENGKAQVHLPDKWRLVKGSDSLKLPVYDEVLPYYGYSAAFRIGDLWGFLNQQGEESIEPKYDELVFNKGSVVFGRTTTDDGSFVWSVIDRYGREAQSEKYNEVVRFSNGFAAVRNNDKWGFINSLGAEIVTPQFDAVRNFSGDRAAVLKNGQWGFVGKNGTEEIPYFTEMPSFEEVIGETKEDTIAAIRESFPLFLMEVLGDFNQSCTCVEDLTQENIGDKPLCINKIGKAHPEMECQPFTKVADIFIPEAELNPALKVIRIPGRWIDIDSSGKEIQ